MEYCNVCCGWFNEKCFARAENVLICFNCIVGKGV